MVPSSTPELVATAQALTSLPPLISASQLARVLGISNTSIWRMRSAGRLPKPILIGRLVRWRADEVSRWIDAGCPSLDAWEAKGRR